jgi:uncharacterized repeat protein (TIGR01451 family)
VTSPPDSATVPASQVPELALVKTASPSAPSAFRAGQVVTYSFAVTNTGNVTVHGIAIDETAFSGTGSLSAIDCPATTLAPGATTTCTATYTLTTADIDAGEVTNTAHATGTSPGGANVTSPPDSAVVTANQVPELALVKLASISGNVATYRFMVVNTGNTTIHGIAIDETAFSGTGSLSAIDCPVTTLAPGASTTCTATYTLTTADIDAGKVTNTATATGTSPSGADVTSPPSSAEVTASQTPALTLVKLAPAGPLATPGQQVTYRFEVTNTGNVTIHGIAIDETAFSGTGSLSAIDCPVTTLAPGASTECTATYTVTQADIDAGKVTNTATATGTSPSGAGVTSPPDSATVPASQVPELALVKTVSPSAPSSFRVGQVVTYSFAVTNTGNVTVHGIAIDETAFSGTGSLSAIDCPVTTLAPNASTTCTATYTLTTADIDAGKVTNTATATGTSPSGAGVTSPPDSAEVTADQLPELALVKTASTSGNVVTYRFIVVNTGNTTINNIAIDETAFSGTGTRPTVSCPVTTLAPGASTVCTATYTATTADIDAGYVTNSAVAAGDSPSGARVTSPPDGAVVPLVQSPALAVVKTASTSGDVVNYRFVVSNTGNTTIHDLAIDETAFSGTGTPPAATCAATTLAPGASTVCTATYTLTTADIDAGKVTNSAVAVDTAPSGQPTISLPSEATVTVTQAPALALVKTVSPSAPSSFHAGQVVTYSFHVTNTGNTTIHDLAIAETAFSGTGSMSAITCPVTVLAPGESTVCTATYSLTQADVDAGHVTNAAVAVGTSPSGERVTSASATASIPVVHAPELELGKTASPATVTAVGQRVTYSFVVVNTGNTTIHDLVIAETAFSGTGSLSAITCLVTTLAPGKQTICTATYTVTRADFDAGNVTNTAVATAELPSGKAVTSAPSTATVTARKASIVSGVPGGGSGPSAAEIGSGVGLILVASSAVTGLVVRRRRRGTGQWW